MLRSPTWLAGVSTVLLLTAALTASAGPAAAAGDPQPYIIGGSDATQPYPFAARLLTDYPGMGTARCTATLVTDRGRTGVVTAAHCVSDLTTALAVPAGNVTVQVGNRLDKLTNIPVSRVQVHPRWDWGTGTDAIADLAVLVLPRGTRLGGIPLGRWAGPGRGVRLLGWGMASIGAPQPPANLQQLDTVITDVGSCAAAGISAGEICVDGREGAAACFGDSGGPALGRAGSWWVVLGIASRGAEQTGGAPCAGPTAYTDVTQYREWIRAALTGHEQHPRRHVAPGAADRFMRLR